MMVYFAGNTTKCGAGVNMAFAFETFEVTEGSGKYEIQLSCLRCEGGLIVSLLGGEYSHVGGVVLASPRAQQRENRRFEDVWDIPVPGHLDTIAALPLARALCRRSRMPVTVTCGIHIDDATKADLEQIMSNCDKALQKLLVLLEERSPS
jgi:hypothetical protein